MAGPGAPIDDTFSVSERHYSAQSSSGRLSRELAGLLLGEQPVDRAKGAIRRTYYFGRPARNDAHGRGPPRDLSKHATS